MKGSRKYVKRAIEMYYFIPILTGSHVLRSGRACGLAVEYKTYKIYNGQDGEIWRIVASLVI